jgi:hypothetical protein
MLKDSPGGPNKPLAPEVTVLVLVAMVQPRVPKARIWPLIASACTSPHRLLTRHFWVSVPLLRAVMAVFDRVSAVVIIMHSTRAS